MYRAGLHTQTTIECVGCSQRTGSESLASEAIDPELGYICTERKLD